MHSHHSHSGQYCTHATGDLEACIEQAIDQNFETFCLTEHIPRFRECDLYPGEATSLVELMDMFERYHAHARQLQQRYEDKIQILVGLETEYIREIDLCILQLLIARYPVDMMVGSVHHVNGIPIDYDATMWLAALASCNNDEPILYETYFAHQYRLITTLRPRVIGHFDVISLFAPAAKKTNLLQWASVTSAIQRNIKAVVAYGGIFELNAAAYRKGWDTAYPAPNIVALILAAGGTFCLSDDSHGPHQVGANFHRLQEYVRAIGITELSHLSRQQRDSRGKGEGEKHDAWTVVRETSAETLSRFLQWTPRSD